MPESAAHYKAAGVNLEAGDQASALMYEASRATWANRKGLPGEIQLPVESFSGVRFLDGAPFGNAVIGMNFDGVGTKIEVAERVGRHNTIAHDLFAMVCDDASIRGCEPLVVGSILDCNKLDTEVVGQLAEGMVEAARLSRVAVINGEIAELGSRVRGFGEVSYNWGGAVVWGARRDRLLTGLDIKVGDAVVAVREGGVRSNGISLLRRVFQRELGDSWHTTQLQGSTLGEQMLAPSVIYTPLLVTLTGGIAGDPTCSIHGAAHITGGGVPGKLGRLLKPSGLGAELSDLFDPCDLMTECQKRGAVPDAEAYQVWNMGQGLIIVTADDAKVVSQASAKGLVAKRVGTITSAAQITIRSKGHWKATGSDRLAYPVG